MLPESQNPSIVSDGLFTPSQTNMAAPNNIIVAFDLYGTLLSTSSIAKELASLTNPDKATEIATLWRRYQLEYTWRLNSMSALPLHSPHPPSPS